MATRCGICQAEIDLLVEACDSCGLIPSTFHTGTRFPTKEPPVDINELKDYHLTCLEPNVNPEWNSIHLLILSAIEAKLGKYNEARKFAEEAMALVQITKSTELWNREVKEAQCIATIGRICFQENKFDEAEGFFIRARELSSKIGYQEGINGSTILLDDLRDAKQS